MSGNKTFRIDPNITTSQARHPTKGTNNEKTRQKEPGHNTSQQTLKEKYRQPRQEHTIQTDLSTKPGNPQAADRSLFLWEGFTNLLELRNSLTLQVVEEEICSTVAAFCTKIL